MQLLLKTAANELALFGLVLGTLVAAWIILTIAQLIQRRTERTVMQQVADELRSKIKESLPRFFAMREDEVIAPIVSGKWSKKEILGHLIDSASNNHQRFVRAQLSPEIRLPAYEQAPWVRTQRYQDESWETLVRFWSDYNMHLAHVIAGIEKRSLSHKCFIGENEPVTLEFLARDYVRHLEHHLEQILN
ncbi:MAG: DinB family protein [Ignavibacteriales bacterium]|nr:DinB family protein [Ignavibacteriales bacterium]